MQTFKDWIGSITSLIGDTLVNLLLTVAVAVFFVAIIRFMWARRTSRGDAIKDAQNQLGWSIIALFVMFSIWGIITLLQTLLPNNTNTIRSPSIQTSNTQQTQTSPRSPVQNSADTSTTRSTGILIGGSCRISAECASGLYCNALNVCAIPRGGV